MTLRRRIKARNLFARTRKHRSSVQLKELPVNVRAFLEVEKPTFNFIKLLSVFFFTLEMGILATLFATHFITLLFFNCALFTSISLFFLYLSLSSFKKSIFSIRDYENKFFTYRKKGHDYLNLSIYFCLLNFSSSFFIYTFSQFQLSTLLTSLPIYI